MTKTPLIEQIEAMPPAQREGAIAVLDHFTRPLQAREIERFLRTGGVPRARAVKLAGCLKHWGIIAMLGPEPEGDHG